MCNKWQANGVKLLGAFDGNPAGHVIAMLYKFGVDNGIFQNELTAVSLKVVGLFPSDLQVNGCPFWQSAFTPRCMPAVLGNIQRLHRLAILFRQDGNDQVADECAEWARQMAIWRQHEYTAELDSLSRITSWDAVLLAWITHAS